MIPTGLLGAIPSPSGNSISVGPLDLRAYGLMIALGVLAAVTVSYTHLTLPTTPYV